MKKILIVGTVLLMSLGMAFAADPVEGYWLSVDDKTGKITAGWEIFQEGGVLYGMPLSVADHPQDVIAKNCKDEYQGFPIPGKVSHLRVVGTPWIFGLSMSQPGTWSGGNVIDADAGKMYKCKIIFHAADGKKYKTDVLEMRGEIGLGIGRSQYWRKATKAEAEGVR